jgi:hypothetical protein
MKGNNNKFLTGGFTMKQICKIYSSTISFVRAFERAAGVVVLSTTLMFNCATTKSADTSSRYVAESTTTSREVNYKGDPNETKLQKLVNKAAELALKSQQLYEIEEQARLKEEQALKKAEELCIKAKNFLENKEKECATNGCDDETKTKLVNSWRMYEEKCSEYK